MTITKNDCDVTFSSDVIDYFIANGGDLSIFIDHVETDISTLLVGSTYTQEFSDGVYYITLKNDNASDSACLYVGCSTDCTVYAEGEDSIKFVLADLLDSIIEDCEDCECVEAKAIYTRLTACE